MVSRNESRRFRLPLALLAAPRDDAVAGNRGRFPVIRQLTTNTTGTIVEPNVRLERAESVTFVSDGDVLGPGSAPGHREVYLYHRLSDTMRRLTTTTNGESSQAIRETDEIHSRRPKYVVFVSTGDLDARVGNADRNSEIFLSKGRKRIWQLTRTAGCENLQPSIQENGDAIAFASNCDLVPGRNPGSATQLFSYFEVANGDPWLSADTCKVSEGCCNVANGCYTPILGRQVRPPSSPRN